MTGGAHCCIKHLGSYHNLSACSSGTRSVIGSDLEGRGFSTRLLTVLHCKSIPLELFISHTQRVSVTLAITLCPSSSLLSSASFFGFSTSSLEPLHGFASNFVWMFLEWTPTKFVKIGVLPLFFMELWVILCNFWPILKKSSSIKPLTRNRSYLVWRVPSGSSF